MENNNPNTQVPSQPQPQPVNPVPEQMQPQQQTYVQPQSVAPVAIEQSQQFQAQSREQLLNKEVNESSGISGKFMLEVFALILGVMVVLGFIFGVSGIAVTGIALFFFVGLIMGLTSVGKAVFRYKDATSQNRTIKIVGITLFVIILAPILSLGLGVGIIIILLILFPPQS